MNNKTFGCNRFFMETEQGLCLPRALLVDLEPTVCDEVQKGPCKDLFHHSNIISGVGVQPHHN